MRELTINTDAFNTAAAKLLATSKREAVVVMKEQARGIMRHLVDNTPPGGKGVRGSAALARGKAAVARDISSIYGTPKTAFDLISRLDGEETAGAFWKHFKRGEMAAANAILKHSTGKSFSPFDGGTVHRRFKGGSRPRKARSVVFFAQNPQELKAYIKAVQQRVGFLASGWNEASARLGIKTPAWVWRNEGPGGFKLVITETGIRISATNEVGFASSIRDMHERVQRAVNDQAATIERRFAKFMEERAKKAGFKT